MHIECRSDTEYAERPVAFTWQGKRLEVVEISDRWRTPDGKGFRVRTADDHIFELFYQEMTCEWEIRQT